ncbi:ABC transporter ATP-binding protein [Pontibacillus litoralis]|uniref:Carnitine transport ATP-binding protein OpuCA n=1 Tax=Pontibacillus litoralis JSM 072002 TaxID=1385512 RepID=A0A0A5G367_9BACI|nr:ABC transporter ATP-binding protein [Pontibacillus litoralis]KGX87546.1 choline ABC transporter ATP-binding protein [Pontibacillus litoralis JSM 072002]
MIEFKNVSKSYKDGAKAVKHISFTVEEGELLTLIGPSGCGKTTTLKMINRLIEPTEGHIYIRNRDISKYKMNELRWNIGYVLQQIALFPHMTIEENIAIVPEMKSWSKSKIRARIDELMNMVGLDPVTYRKRKPSELSGGQQQRVGVIRALAADPDIILMDEPFSALDPISREQLQIDIQHLQKEIKKTIVFVTHDIEEALALGDRVCLMNEGEIVQISTPQEIILQPENAFVKNFVGERKSPWQTAVDVMVDVSVEHVLVNHSPFPQEGLYFVQEEEGFYKGAILNGEYIQYPTLRHDMHLRHATSVFDWYDVQILPVVNGDQLIGTLSYRDIVHYLQQQTTLENGVIQQ